MGPSRTPARMASVEGVLGVLGGVSRAKESGVRDRQWRDRQGLSSVAMSVVSSLKYCDVYMSRMFSIDSDSSHERDRPLALVGDGTERPPPRPTDVRVWPASMAVVR